MHEIKFISKFIGKMKTFKFKAEITVLRKQGNKMTHSDGSDYKNVHTRVRHRLRFAFNFKPHKLCICLFK